MDPFVILVVLGVIVIAGVLVWHKHSSEILAQKAKLDGFLAGLRHEPTIGTAPAPVHPTPAAPATPAVPTVPAPVPTQPAPATPAVQPAAPAAPTELAPAYIDLADFYKALGGAVAAGYSGGVYLNGKMEHNGFGPFDYFETAANGNVVRTQRPATVPPPVSAPTDVAIGAE